MPRMMMLTTTTCPHRRRGVVSVAAAALFCVLLLSNLLSQGHGFAMTRTNTGLVDQQQHWATTTCATNGRVVQQLMGQHSLLRRSRFSWVRLQAQLKQQGEQDPDPAGPLNSKVEEDGATMSQAVVIPKTEMTNRNKRTDSGEDSSYSSKRGMLKFVIPALGIYLANPLMSNIDNAFVGQTVGTTGLAALSPATICTDQMLYLFSFLARATTGIVSRAYAVVPTNDRTNDRTETGNKEAARQAGSAPLTVSLLCGVLLSLFYALYTPQMLALLNVNPALRASSASYIYWRGAIAWAALAQSICLSILMATRDAMTPLRIIGAAALFNIVGDYLLCVYPLQWGCSGAAAATAGATLLSCAVMLRALKRKDLLPPIRLPSKKEMMGLSEFTGPLLAITLTRLAGTIAMQRTAMTLGVQPLAAYQVCINILFFFSLFGEPLSQLSQTKLPALIDSNDGRAVKATIKSILVIAASTSLGIGAAAYAAIQWGGTMFISDPGVLLLAQQAAPAVFLSVATTIMTIAVDGAMLASKDFSFMLACGFSSYLFQLLLLKRCTSLSFIFGSFTLRLGSYAILSLVRAAVGRGVLGRVIFESQQKALAPNVAL